MISSASLIAPLFVSFVTAATPASAPQVAAQQYGPYPGQVQELPRSSARRLEPDSWSPLITWRAPDGFYAASIHATLMPDGQVLFMGFERDTFDPLQATVTRRSAFLYAPTPHGQPLPAEVVISNRTQPIDLDNAFVPPSFLVTDQLYCGGHTLTADGDFFTAGGLQTVSDTGGGGTSFFGLSYATIYDDPTWTRVPADMTVVGALGSPARYYPTCMRLSDGRILVIGGYDSILPSTAENLSAEAYDPATGLWEILSDYGATPTQIFNPDYTHSFVLPERLYTIYDLLMFGEDGLPLFFSLDTVPGWAGGLVRPGTLPGQMPNFGTTTAMLPIRIDEGEWGYGNGSVLMAGGAHMSTHQHHADVYDPTTNTWMPRIDMDVNRHHPTSVTLPDGRMLLLGGHDVQGDPNVSRASYIDPRTGFRHVLGKALADEINGYHHISLLLPDGRVLFGGGREENTFTSLEKPTFRYYYPSYMSRPRPTIDATPTTLTLRQSFNVQSSGAVPVEVVLMGLGSMTHSFDANQRHVELEITASSTLGSQHTLTVAAPPDSRVAPPGYYMLFVLDENRVPSEGTILRVL
jgi:hypothetical protein